MQPNKKQPAAARTGRSPDKNQNPSGRASGDSAASSAASKTKNRASARPDPAVESTVNPWGEDAAGTEPSHGLTPARGQARSQARQAGREYPTPAAVEGPASERPATSRRQTTVQPPAKRPGVARRTPAGHAIKKSKAGARPRGASTRAAGGKTSSQSRK